MKKIILLSFLLLLLENIYSQNVSYFYPKKIFSDTTFYDKWSQKTLKSFLYLEQFYERDTVMLKNTKTLLDIVEPNNLSGYWASMRLQLIDFIVNNKRLLFPVKKIYILEYEPTYTSEWDTYIFLIMILEDNMISYMFKTKDSGLEVIDVQFCQGVEYYIENYKKNITLKFPAYTLFVLEYYCVLTEITSTETNVYIDIYASRYFTRKILDYCCKEYKYYNFYLGL